MKSGLILFMATLLVATLMTACNDSTEPESGSIQVGITTTGEFTDLDGYTVNVDGGQNHACEANDTVVLQNIAPGDHDVELSNLTTGCAVTGANPRSVSVTAGATASTSFEVGCSSEATGSLEVTVATNGPLSDPDGYVIMIDGSLCERVAVNDMAQFTGLSVGDHRVALEDVDTGCLVSGSNPRPVSVIADTTTATTFNVTCPTTTGTLEVTIVTSGGGAVDPDGYLVTVDESIQRRVAVNDVAVFSGLSTGNHFVYLSDVTVGCAADGPNPRTVSVPDGGTAQTTFGVGCPAPLYDHLTLISDLREVDIMKSDGSGRFNLISGVLGGPATWSPNGTTIAFASGIGGGNNSNIYAINVDSRGLVKLTDNTGDDIWPAWSPNGTKIAYCRDNETSSMDEVYVMNADGSNPTQLTSGYHDIFPRWSPDSQKIVFVRSAQDIYVMNADGTGLALLMPNGYWPVWSPDGTKIAFVRAIGGAGEIFVMNADGTGVTQITSNPATDTYPEWSPDGQKIAFASARGPTWDIFVMNADGSNTVNLTNSDWEDETMPQWSPSQ
jgi:hypothetical protein